MGLALLRSCPTDTSEWAKCDLSLACVEDIDAGTLAVATSASGEGGTIDFSSRPGEGSRFWVELPLSGH